MNLQINGKITSLELLKEINFFRKEEGSKTELGHNDLLKIIRDEFEEEIGLGKISQTHYTHSQNKQEYPMYILTFSQAKQVLIRESKFVRKAVIHYLEELEQRENLSEKDRLILLLHNGSDTEKTEAFNKLLELEKEPLKKELEYKENIIMGLTDEIELKDKRQILNQVVRYNGANIQERWRLLYFEFEKKYHMDLSRRLDAYNQKNKTKIKKLDYIVEILGKLNELYEIACKLFNSDIEKIIQGYKNVCMVVPMT